MTNNKNVTPATQASTKPLETSLTYEDKVIQKIVGHALQSVDGLLAVSGGFFKDLKNKTVNSENVTDGVNVEVGTKEVAVDLKIIVEYQKDIPAIAENIQKVIVKEVEKATQLKVVEINIDVVDIKTKEEHEADSVTVQDRLESAASSAGEFASEQAEKAKGALSDGVEAAKEKAGDAKDAIQEATEPRVK